jgi:hypothetical protein
MEAGVCIRLSGAGRPAAAGKREADGSMAFDACLTRNDACHDVDAALACTLEQGNGPIVRVEHHLLR